MTGNITVVDYGLGNIFSVSRAIEVCGGQCILSSDPEEIRRAEKILLPGVGAFSSGMEGLRKNYLDEAIREAASSGGYVLGICLGMQMLASLSEEFGEHKGLGLIPGRVVPVPASGLCGQAHKIPHTGWSKLESSDARKNWSGTLLDDTLDETWVYMVHSFHFVPDDAEDQLAVCDYNGRVICAAITRDTVTGFQFHPEKSGPAGLRILQRFIDN